MSNEDEINTKIAMKKAEKTAIINTTIKAVKRKRLMSVNEYEKKKK